MVLWFFQAVHPTHEWMEEKLQTYFRMDTGCLNHNTSMKNCKFSLLTRSLSSYKETFFKSLTDHLNNTRYQIMMKCWENDPDARPTFTELKNQLKDMETLHKVRILINMKDSFHARPTGLGQLVKVFNLTAFSLDSVLICTHLCNFYKVWIVSFCYVTEASNPRKTAKKRTRMSQ